MVNHGSVVVVVHVARIPIQRASFPERIDWGNSMLPLKTPTLFVVPQPGGQHVMMMIMMISVVAAAAWVVAHYPIYYY
jgi:hypothetical protein